MSPTASVLWRAGARWLSASEGRYSADELTVCCRGAEGGVTEGKVECVCMCVCGLMFNMHVTLSFPEEAESDYTKEGIYIGEHSISLLFLHTETLNTQL